LFPWHEQLKLVVVLSTGEKALAEERAELGRSLLGLLCHPEDPHP